MGRESTYGTLVSQETTSEGVVAIAGHNEGGLRALGSFVHGTALLEGVVDGVEYGGQAGTAMSDGGAAAGVFVKASLPWPALRSFASRLQTYRGAN